MIRLALLVVAAGSLLSLGSGCATPAYSAEERNQQIARNWEYESKQMVDDFDHVLLLRPASRMTIWNVR